MISLSKFLKESQWTQVVALLLLLLLLAIGTVPGYLTGRWQWKQPPPVTNLQALKNLRNGLILPSWQTIEQSQQQIGEQKWSIQLIKKQDSQTQALLLLLPQNGPMDQPEVEWTEINGWGKLRWGKWNIAQYRSAKFTVKQPTQTDVEAKFFRAVTQQDTFAVLQWYAQPNGGNPSPVRWFVADQLAKWYKQRVPWVAVTILVPMEPLGQVEKIWPLAESIGQTVQAALMADSLQSN
jgi:cyanoexosortase B-associated protein